MNLMKPLEESTRNLFPGLRRKRVFSSGLSVRRFALGWRRTEVVGGAGLQPRRRRQVVAGVRQPPGGRDTPTGTRLQPLPRRQAGPAQARPAWPLRQPPDEGGRLDRRPGLTHPGYKPGARWRAVFTAPDRRKSYCKAL